VASSKKKSILFYNSILTLFCKVLYHYIDAEYLKTYNVIFTIDHILLLLVIKMKKIN